MTDVYEKAVQALEEVAKAEEKPELMVAITLPMSIAISVYCQIFVGIKEMENRIANDLRQDHKLPTPRERTELGLLRQAVDSFVCALRAADQPSEHAP
jgi:hypothetical protein